MSDVNEDSQEPGSAASSGTGTGVSTGPNNPLEGQEEAFRPKSDEDPGEMAGGGQHGG